MAKTSKKDEAAKEAMEAMDYILEQAERALQSLRQKQERRVVKQLRAQPLPKTA